MIGSDTRGNPKCAHIRDHLWGSVDYNAKLDMPPSPLCSTTLRSTLPSSSTHTVLSDSRYPHLEPPVTLQKRFKNAFSTPHSKPSTRISPRVCVTTREEVETRKIGRNETRTFQGLFLGCTRENEKLGKEPNRSVSFLMNRAWKAGWLFLFPW